MRYIIIGGSAAAISALEAIRSIDRDSPIDLFSDEPTPLFSRVLLPYYIAEELSKPLLNFRSADFFEQNKVTPHLGVRIQQISVDSKVVQTERGDHHPFDKLLMAWPHMVTVSSIWKSGILSVFPHAPREYSRE